MNNYIDDLVVKYVNQNLSDVLSRERKRDNLMNIGIETILLRYVSITSGIIGESVAKSCQKPI